jgi:hypothetical protein
MTTDRDELLKLCDEILEGVPTSDETLGDIHAPSARCGLVLVRHPQMKLTILQRKTFHLVIDDATACGVKMVITNVTPQIGLMGWDGKAFSYRLTTAPKQATCRGCRRAISLGHEG